MIENASNRRTILGAIAATCAGALPAASAPADSDLDHLIAADRHAAADREEAERALKRAESDYLASTAPVEIHCALGGFCLLKNYTREQAREWIAHAFERESRRFTKCRNELADDILAALDRQRAANLATVDRLFEEDEARREAFGLGAIVRRHRAAVTFEEEAGRALLNYPVARIEEARRMADYVLTSRHAAKLGETGLALLRSITREATS